MTSRAHKKRMDKLRLEKKPEINQDPIGTTAPVETGTEVGEVSLTEDEVSDQSRLLGDVMKEILEVAHNRKTSVHAACVLALEYEKKYLLN